MSVTARRSLDAPIVRPDMDGRMGRNINGPSLIAAPPWLARPLACYYLYFADHRGSYIRLALAERIECAWRWPMGRNINGPSLIGSLADARGGLPRARRFAVLRRAADAAGPAARRNGAGRGLALSHTSPRPTSMSSPPNSGCGCISTA